MDKRKRNKAAALEYDSTYKAPIVTALGVGEVADRIVEKAYENDVPVVENEELAELLQNVNIGECIPNELYDTVAKIIAYIVDMDYTITKRRGKK